jgi:N-acetylglucosaminyldiphosphoundecaprenol N-acetyl-beta-D-mannosaminyltransferase
MEPAVYGCEDNKIISNIVMFRLKTLTILGSKAELASLPEGKLLINTVNAHSFNTAKKDQLFADALTNGDVLIPDGVSIVKACKWIKAKSQPKERIAGWDLFSFEMEKLERESEELRTKSEESKIVMFMGSSQKVLDLIVKRAAVDYPHLEVVTYSPPYKPAFSDEDNKAIIDAINAANPDLLWIGMTAPKQEKWTYSHWKELNIHCHVGTIGAVFDFFAGTVERAPIWWQEHGLEWLYRLIKEPKRMWRRYIIGNTLFLWNMTKE